MKKIFFAGAAVLFACGVVVPAAQAQKPVEKLVINKGNYPLDMSGFAAGGDNAAQWFRHTLESDLFKCGYFSRAPADRAVILLTGSANGGGSVSAQCLVQDRIAQATRLSKNYSAGANEVIRRAHQAADDIIKAVTGKDGFCGSQVAMIGNTSGHKELYLSDWDGSNLRQLTRDESINLDPKWRPGGKEILYTSYVRGSASLFTVDLTSGQRRQLIRSGGIVTGGAYSPDGSRIALIMSRDGNTELYVMGASGSGLTRLTRTPDRDEASPTWSPDGRRICFVSGPPNFTQLYVIDAGGGDPVRVTSGGRMNESPDWGPNGMIAYQSNFGGQYQIFVVDPASHAASQVSKGGAAYEDPSWAPDGRHIVCTRVVGYEKGVCILDTQNDAPISLTSNQRGDWSQPAFEPRK
jgi:TolB protein